MARTRSREREGVQAPSALQGMLASQQSLCVSVRRGPRPSGFFKKITTTFPASSIQKILGCFACSGLLPLALEMKSVRLQEDHVGEGFQQGLKVTSGPAHSFQESVRKHKAKQKKSHHKDTPGTSALSCMQGTRGRHDQICLGS